MPTTYFQRSTASDLSVPGEYDLQLLETTAAEVARVVELGAGATSEGYHYTEPGVPGADGVTGDFSVEVDIAVGDSNVMVSAAVARVNSSGAVQNQSAFTAEQTAAGAVLTFNFSSPNLGTWATGDRLRVAVRYRNSHTHTSRDVSVGFNTADAAVVAPWSAAAPIETISGTATTDVSATGTLFVPTASVPTISGTATTNVAVSGALSVPASGVLTIAGTATTDVAASGTLVVPATGGVGPIPVVESVTPTASVDGGTPPFDMPATRPDGDLYVLYAGSDADPAITAPTGWNTEVARVDSAGNTGYVLVAWRIGDSEPATYNLGGSVDDGQATVVRVSGIDVANPVNRSASNADAFSGAIAPSVTPDVANTLVLRIFHSDGAEFETPLPGTQLHLDQIDPPHALTSEDGPASGEPSGTATALMTASDEWIAATLAIAPTAGSSVPTITGTATTDIAASGTLSVPIATVSAISGTATTDVATSGSLDVPTATVAAISGTASTDMAISGALSVPTATVPVFSGIATTDVTASGSLSVPTPTVSAISGTATTDVTLSGSVSAPTDIPSISGTATTDVVASGTLVSPTATVPMISGTASTDVEATGVLSVPAPSVPTIGGTATTDISSSGVLSIPTATVPTVEGTAGITIDLSGQVVTPAAAVATIGGTALTTIGLTGTLAVPTATVPTISGIAGIILGAGGVLVDPSIEAVDLDVTIGTTRVGSIAPAVTRHGTAAAGSTRQSPDPGPTRQAVTVGDTRQDRSP